MSVDHNEGFDPREPQRRAPILTRAQSWNEIFPLDKRAYKTSGQEHNARERLRAVAIQHFSDTVQHVLHTHSQGKFLNDEGGIGTTGGYFKREASESVDDFTCSFAEDNLVFHWSHATPGVVFERGDYIPYYVGDINHAYRHESIDDLLAEFRKQTGSFRTRIATERTRSKDRSLDTSYQQEINRIRKRIERLERHLMGYFATETYEHDIIEILEDKPLRVGYLLYPANSLRTVGNVATGRLRPDNL